MSDLQEVKPMSWFREMIQRLKSDEFDTETRHIKLDELTEAAILAAAEGAEHGRDAAMAVRGLLRFSKIDPEWEIWYA